MKFSILALVFSAAVSTAFAQEIPSCLKGKTPLAIDNARVIRLKASTPVQYHDRGHVKGEIVRVFADKTGHDHFLIQIGPKAIDTLEVVYNSEFGQLPGPHEGQSVEACGDYITLKAAPKPDPRENGANKSDAIIHWVHAADPGTTHEGGYLVMDGVLCGQSVPPGGHH